MTLRAVGKTYSLDDRAALLDDAAAIIEQRGYDPTLSAPRGVTIIGAVSAAASAYGDPSSAFRDAMFLVNTRFLIETGTPSRTSDVAWVTWTRSLDQESAATFLHSTAAIVREQAS